MNSEEVQKSAVCKIDDVEKWTNWFKSLIGERESESLLLRALE